MSGDQPTPASDLRVIQCNYREGTHIAAPGARAYLIGGSNGDGFERRRFLVRSRGGRFVDKWERTDRMEDWRVKVIPPEHPHYDRLRDAAYFADNLDYLPAGLVKARPEVSS